MCSQKADRKGVHEMKSGQEKVIASGALPIAKWEMRAADRERRAPPSRMMDAYGGSYGGESYTDNRTANHGNRLFFLLYSCCLTTIARKDRGSGWINRKLPSSARWSTMPSAIRFNFIFRDTKKAPAWTASSGALSVTMRCRSTSSTSPPWTTCTIRPA